jgi:hypothetical protein
MESLNGRLQRLERANGLGQDEPRAVFRILRDGDDEPRGAWFTLRFDAPNIDFDEYARDFEQRVSEIGIDGWATEYMDGYRRLFTEPVDDDEQP